MPLDFTVTPLSCVERANFWRSREITTT